MSSGFSFSKNSKKELATVEEILQRIAERALELSPIDFGIPKHGGKRTAATQMELYLSNASQRDGVTKKSKHQSGWALDFYAFVNGKASWETEHVAIVACAFFQAAGELGVSMRWGGFFKPYKIHDDDDYPLGWDGGHVEVVSVNGKKI